VIDGQVIETGVSFILTFDYDKISELFKSRKEIRRIRRHNKQVTNRMHNKNKKQQQQQGSDVQPPSNHDKIFE